MTQIEIARKGKYSREMLAVAKSENVTKEYVRTGVAAGRIVITSSLIHKPKKVCGIGKGLRTKVNVNIETSPDRSTVKQELAKLKVAIECGADAVMDLSTGGDMDKTRALIIKNSPIAVGTVPIYQASVEAIRKCKSVVEMTPEEMFAGIEKHIKDGVDFITVHCGVTKETIGRLRKEGRIANIVSRGGAFLTEWIMHNGKENPLFSEYDYLLELAKKYDVTLSLGDGFRPGCLANATDRAQVQELIILGELAERALKAGVQAMIEGPGHMPINQIEANILLQKRLCHEAPFYVLGPLVTDIAPGYDHITSAIGGAIAGTAGADFLCYVTPAEHLGLPDINDVREGTIASKIAAHAADIGKGIPGAMELDKRMAFYRKNLDWDNQKKYALDPAKITKYRKSGKGDNTCTMCGEFCAMKRITKYLG